MSRWNRRLIVKALEDRAVPAFFSVNALTDTGTGSGNTGDLRYCINLANVNAGADFITFGGGSSGTINLTAELKIAEQLTINGGGQNICTIDGKQQFRIFNVQTTQPVSISALKLANAAVFNGGGAIRMHLDDSKVTISSCIITNNTGGIGSSGGGVFVAKGGSLTVNQSTFSGNSGFRGAGIYFYIGGSLNMTNCTLSGNMESGSTGGGGAIYFYGDVGADGFAIRNTTISGNTAAGRGGGISINTAKGDFTITNSTITDNTSFSFGGGGLAANKITGVVNLESTIVAGNKHPASPDILAGGIVNAVNCLIGVTNGISFLNQTSSILGNLQVPVSSKLAPLSNNGLSILTHLPLPGSPVRNAGLNSTGLTFDQRGQPRDQEGQTDIGAIESTSAVPTGSVVTIPAITSPGTAPNTVQVRYTDDGAIDVAHIGLGDIQIFDPVGKLLTVIGATVDVGSNGTPRIATYTFVPPGGSWDSGDSGTYNVSIAANEVFDTGVPDAVPAGTAGIFVVSMKHNYVVNAANDEATDTDGLLSLREAINRANAVGSADTIMFDDAVFGGAQTITLALGDFPLVDAISIVGPGTALAIDAIAKSRHFSIDATGTGNVISISDVTLINGKRSGIFPDDRGGSIRVADETLTVLGCILSNNTAEATGGAIYTESPDTSLTVRDSEVRNNASTGIPDLNVGSGGGISIGQQSKTVIERTWLHSNVSEGAGGGVYFYFGGDVAITGSTISGNTAKGTDTGGGGIYFYGSVIGSGFKITNSTISGNTAANGAGGGLCTFLYDGLIDIANSTIINNVQKAGGGITRNGGADADDSFKLSSTVVAGNKLNNVAKTPFDISLPSPGNIAGDNNLIGVATLANFTLTGTGNLTGTSMSPLDAQLGPLMFNGGLTPTHKPLALSPVIDAGNNAAMLNFDQRDLPFSRMGGTAPEIGSYEIQTGFAHVTTVVVNDGAVQRSRVTSVTVTFDRFVGFAGAPESAFTLTRQGTGAAVTLAANVDNSGSGTVVRLTFVGGAVNGMSLIDGRFTLRVLASQITGVGLDSNGNNFAEGSPNDDRVVVGGPSGQVKLFRLFGDANGNGTVDASDFIQMRLTLGGVFAPFDFNENGTVDSIDFINFRLRFGGTV